MGRVRVYEAGERYGRLTVAVRRDTLGPVHCRCDCGAEHTVQHVAGLAYGNTRSCGCLKLEALVARSMRHGMAGTPIYMIWAEMIARCTRPTHARFADYGGRGVTVCERWRTFESFYADMGERPEGRTLDRINNDLGYAPDNCRWASVFEQNRNRRRPQPKPRCKHGHRYPIDCPRTPAGKRRCLPCERVWAAAARSKKRGVA